MKLITSVVLAVMMAAPVAQAGEKSTGTVIEIVTFTLKSGVTPEAFRPIDAAVGSQHVAKQPGFISRESAAGENNTWLVIIHWRSAKDADASMASFEKAPATQAFMEKIDASTLVMKRYTKP